MEQNILVLGDSGTGKTHFAVQLVGRLFKSSKAIWKPKSTPENLEIFKSGFDKLAKGLQIDHTPSAFHQDIAFHVVNQHNAEINFTYPDYAGEQLRNVVNNRSLNKAWQDRITASTSWLLFIKINDIKQVEDIITRGMPEYGIISKSRAVEEQGSFQIGDQAFYTELLQMLIRIKGASFLMAGTLPPLTIMLTCWDEYRTAHPGIQQPADALKDKMPMFYSFLTGNWPQGALNIIGLSATERKLDQDTPDEDYLDNGPENYGYWITVDGREEKDLTGIVSLIYHE